MGILYHLSLSEKLATKEPVENKGKGPPSKKRQVIYIKFNIIP